MAIFARDFRARRSRAQEDGELAPELAEWLATLCDDIVGMIRQGPPTLPAKLAPILHFLHASG